MTDQNDDIPHLYLLLSIAPTVYHIAALQGRIDIAEAALLNGDPFPYYTPGDSSLDLHPLDIALLKPTCYRFLTLCSLHGHHPLLAESNEERAARLKPKFDYLRSTLATLHAPETPSSESVLHLIPSIDINLSDDITTLTDFSDLDRFAVLGALHMHTVCDEQIDYDAHLMATTLTIRFMHLLQAVANGKLEPEQAATSWDDLVTEKKHAQEKWPSYDWETCLDAQNIQEFQQALAKGQDTE